MLHFFTKASLLTTGVLIGLTVLSVFIRNAWCRYACPYGALLGIFAVFSPARIKRNPETCTHCGKCRRACPFHLTVDQQTQVLSPVCSGCMDCVNACPAPDTLSLNVIGAHKAVFPSQAGIFILAFFWGLVYLATITGHWKSQLTDHEYRMWLKTSDQSMLQHPPINSPR